MLKTREGFIMRQLGNEYMVVAVGEAAKYFNGMIRLNETGAFFWENMEKGIEKSALVDKMLERFDDLDRETAEKDLDEFVAKIRFALE